MGSFTLGPDIRWVEIALITRSILSFSHNTMPFPSITQQTLSAAYPGIYSFPLIDHRTLILFEKAYAQIKRTLSWFILQQRVALGHRSNEGEVSSRDLGDVFTGLRCEHDVGERMASSDLEAARVRTQPHCKMERRREGSRKVGCRKYYGLANREIGCRVTPHRGQNLECNRGSASTRWRSE